MRRTLLFASLLIAVALVALGIPSLTAWVPADIFSIMVALVAGLGGIGALVLRIASSQPQTTTLPAPEQATVATPGDELDEQFGSVNSGPNSSDQRDEIRERLHTVAVAVLTREGLSEPVAREQLTDGTWTDDPLAASFFAPERASTNLRETLGQSLDSRPLFERRADRAIAVLDARLSGRGGEQ